MRSDYDYLSDLGRNQSRLLGEYVRREGLRFYRVVVGCMRRQAETADLVFGSPLLSGAAYSHRCEDERWNEFDLNGVFESVAPQIALEDAQFRSELEDMRRRIASGDPDVHRVWTTIDTRVMRAWIEGRYSILGESWHDFVARVKAAGDDLRDIPPDANVAVFTSAAPISILVSAAFGSENPDYITRLSGASLTSSITVLSYRNAELTLESFNCVPHLPDASLRTRR